MKKVKHQLAIDVLAVELMRLGGGVFSRYVLNQSKEGKKKIESYEFLGKLLNGKLEEDEEDYLKPYLEPLWKINKAIEILKESKT